MNHHSVFFKHNSTLSFILFFGGVEMAGKQWYGYTRYQWFTFVVCYGIFFFFGGIEASESIYYSLMKLELEIPYKVQGWLTSMSSYSFIVTSPIVGYLMTYVDVKPILVASFACYFIAYVVLYNTTAVWAICISLFIEGMGGVLLDVGVNTLSTVIFSHHRGVMMNILHFFYGLGSSIGPIYSSAVYSWLHQGYKGIFLGLFIPVVIGEIFTIITRLSIHQKEEGGAEVEVRDKPVIELSLPEKGVEISQKLKDDRERKQAEDGNDEKNSQTVVVSISEEKPEVIKKMREEQDVQQQLQQQPQQQTEEEEITFWKSFINPMVGLLSLNMGAVYAIESITVYWAPLYLQEMFGMQPDVEGSRFISLFYIFYTIARLMTGFIIDWLGDAVSMIVFNGILLGWYVIGFSLGRKGVWLLAFSGFIISPFYPTAITLPMEVFGKSAKNTISVILCYALIVNAVVQVLMGYVNQYMGPQWGYPLMAIAMSVLMILCMMCILCWLKQHSRK